MAYEFGFLFGKTSMSSQDLDRWLKVEDFANGIRDLMSTKSPIGDYEILRLAEKILNENLNSETICGVRRGILVPSIVKLRNNIERYKFPKGWLTERYPALWREMKRRVADNGMILVPAQVSRLIQILQYATRLEDSGIAKIYVGGVDQDNSCHLTVEFTRLRVVGTADASELYSCLRFCDMIDIETNDDKVCVSITISRILTDEKSFIANDGIKKKAWILQWNELSK